MNVLFAENDAVSVMIVPAVGRPNCLAIIILSAEDDGLQTVLYLDLRDFRAFLEVMNATR